MEAGGRGKKRTNTYTKCFFVAVYFMSGSVRAFIKPQREITLARSESNEESLYVSGGFYLHSLSAHIQHIYISVAAQKDIEKAAMILLIPRIGLTSVCAFY